MTQLKNIAVSVARLLEAGITKTDRLSMLAYIASRDVGVDTGEVGRAFNSSRAKIYGAMVAFAQHDAKRLIAYSSISHLGFVMLGLLSMNPLGIQGSIYQMVSHGISTGGLFFGIGVLYDRRHTHELNQFGGLWKQMPKFAGIYLIMLLASAGLPGLNGFVGEFLILLGAFALGLPGLSAAQGIDPEGKYELIDPQQPTDTPDKIEIVDVFWYGCPHCWRFLPSMEALEKRKADYIEIRRMPAIFRDSWAIHARAYYTAKLLNAVEQIHRRTDRSESRRGQSTRMKTRDTAE